MKIYRFQINSELLKGDKIVISDLALNHQFKNVLRLQVGDKIMFLDGNGYSCEAECTAVSKDVSVFIKQKEVNSELPNRRMRLAPAILKKDKFEWVIQKCTEIGVDNFIPVVTERTEKQNLNSDRLQKIISEAFEQSEKVFLPKICETKNLLEVIEENSDSKIFYLEKNAPVVSIQNFKNENDVLIFVGPEGGWGDGDLEIFSKNNIPALSFGDTVLRAETASVVIASLYFLGQ